MGNIASRPPADAIASGLSLSARPRQHRQSTAPVAFNHFDLEKKDEPTTVALPFKNKRASRRHSRRPTSLSSSTLNEKRFSSIPFNISTPLLPATPTSMSTAVSETALAPKLPSVDDSLELDTVTLNERQYILLPETEYHVPCDDEEADRLTILHFLLKYAFHGNTKAPVSFHQEHSLAEEPPIADPEPSARVLDIGCGPGTWVLDMATEYPQSDFYGVDICTMFPTTVKPRNAHFKLHNFIEDRLPFPDNHFDYVHVRLVSCRLTEPQLRRLLAEAARVLKPLGFVELVDVECVIQRCGPVSRSLVNEQLKEILAAWHDVDPLRCNHFSFMLMTHGFIDVQHGRVAIPLGWDGPLGDVHAQSFERFLRSLNPDLAAWAGIKGDILQQVMDECKRNQSHLNWHTCYGQKPESLPTPITSRSHSLAEDCNWESIANFVDGYVD